MNHVQQEAFQSLLQTIKDVVERMFNRKLSESALLREHNELVSRVHKLEGNIEAIQANLDNQPTEVEERLVNHNNRLTDPYKKSVEAAVERGELLNMIRETKKHEPILTPATPTEFKQGEIVMVRNSDAYAWKVETFISTNDKQSEYPYKCGYDSWKQCRKLNSKEKGE